MIRAQIRIALIGLLVAAFFSGACHRAAPANGNAEVPPRVVKDTAKVGVPFEEPARTGVPVATGRTFKLRDPGQRDSLRATLEKERELWRASSVRDYRFLLRVGCFCPGTRGWLSMDVRGSRLLRASDSAGKPVALTDWNTRSIDGLFDDLERTISMDAVVQIAFDPRWHFPAYVSTVVLPGPDRWSVIEARDLRRIP